MREIYNEYYYQEIHDCEYSSSSSDGFIRNASPLELTRLLDTIFGKNFATVCSNIVSRLYDEYMTKWRYVGNNLEDLLPKNIVWLKMVSFANKSDTSFEDLAKIVIYNTFDRNECLNKRGSNKIKILFNDDC